MNAPLYDPKDVAIFQKKKPEMGQKYYYILTESCVGVQWFEWENDKSDNEHYDSGNCFLKESDAQHAADAIKAYLKDGRFTSTISVSCPEDEELCTSGSSTWTTYTEEEKTVLYRMMIEDKLDWITVMLILGVACTCDLLIIALWSIL